MKRTTLAGPALLCLAAAAAPVLAQDQVSEANRYCWAENIGFLNWRGAGAPPGSAGARLHATFLSGFIWAENTGWINLGDGSPAGGASYANASGADFGVNVNPATGRLTGLAWGENIGWINFTGAPIHAAVSLTPPRRLHGFAWGENVGWINMDHPLVFVEFGGGTPADWNNDGQVNSTDISAFLTAWLASIGEGGLDADFNGDGTVNSGDISAFLAAWLEAIG